MARYRRKRYGRRKRMFKRTFRRKFRQRRPEVKKYIYNPNGTSVSTTATAYNCLYDLNQGLDSTNRIGRKIFIHYVNVKFQITAADTFQAMRVMLVRYKQGPDPGSPLWMIPGTSAWLGTTDYNYAWVYRDKLYRAAASVDTDTQIVLVNWRIPIFKHFTFSSTGTNTALDSLYLSAVSDSTLASHPTIYPQFKVTFTDA